VSVANVVDVVLVVGAGWMFSLGIFPPTKLLYSHSDYAIFSVNELNELFAIMSYISYAQVKVFLNKMIRVQFLSSLSFFSWVVTARFCEGMCSDLG
ncbi:hypothetical protein L9F63_009398, partial [Diploptera punctata]